MVALAPLRLAIASRREEAERVQEALDELLRRLPLDERARGRIDLAVREAVANAIIHGNRERSDRTVWIEAEADHETLVVRVEDEGEGFDFAQVEDPREPSRLLLPHGRGLWLMRSFVDEVVVERSAKRGASVTLRVHLVDTHHISDQREIMSIEKRTNGKVTILSPRGRITIGEGDVRLREAVRAALDAGELSLVLDMGGVTTIDSSGIGELVSSYTTVSSRGGHFKLLSVPPKVHDILTITQLITVFEVHETEAEAVASFG